MPTSDYLTKTRDEPRISLNKLGEYMVASPSRRRAIIQEQKNPPKVKITWYRHASGYISDFLTKGFNTTILDDGIVDLTARVCKGDFEEKDKVASIALLKNLLKLVLPDLSACKLSKQSSANPKLVISGVEISVNPDAIIRKGKSVGCLKLNLSKSKPLKKEALLYIATLLHHYTDEHLLRTGETSDTKLCISVEVSLNSHELAPTSFKQRRGNIEAACHEIAALWPTL